MQPRDKFEVNALDYLLKPIQPERLAEAVRKIQDKERLREGRLREGKLGLNDQVFVKDGERCWFVSLSNIRLFESDGNYIKVFFDNNRPMIQMTGFGGVNYTPTLAWTWPALNLNGPTATTTAVNTGTVDITTAYTVMATNTTTGCSENN